MKGIDRDIRVSAGAGRDAARKRRRRIAVVTGVLVLALFGLAAQFFPSVPTGEDGIVAQVARFLADPLLSLTAGSGHDSSATGSAGQRDRGILGAAMDAIGAGINKVRRFFRGLFGDGDGLGSLLGDEDAPGSGGTDADSLDAGPDEATYPREAVIAGRVLSDSGEALVGIGVVATAEQLFDVPAGFSVSAGDLQRRAVTDTAGHFRFEQLAAGDYRIQNVPTESFGMAQISVRTGLESVDLVVNELRPLIVTGQVTDTDGQPLAGAVVLPQALGARGVYTDDSGRFELQMDLTRRATRFAIQTQLLGYRDRLTLLDTSRLGRERSMAVRVELERLNPLAAVRGVVRSTADGEPLAGQSVVLDTGGRGSWHRATTDAEGRFAMPEVEVGDGYRLLVDAREGFKPYVRPNVAVSASGLQLDVQLEPDDGRVLSGRIVNPEGMPVPNFQLVVRAKEPPYQAMRMSSDAAGNFVVPNPPHGTLVFESSSTPQVRIAGVDGGSSAPVELVIDTGSNEIYGLVVNEAGQPVAAGSVVLSWERDNGVVRASTTRRAAADAQGRVSFGQVGPGVHTIFVVAEGYKLAQVEHDASRQGFQFVVRLQRAESPG